MLLFRLTYIVVKPLQNKKAQKILRYRQKSSPFLKKKTVFFARYLKFFWAFLFWSGFSSIKRKHIVQRHNKKVSRYMIDWCLWTMENSCFKKMSHLLHVFCLVSLSWSNLKEVYLIIRTFDLVIIILSICSHPCSIIGFQAAFRIWKSRKLSGPWSNF